MTSLAGESAPVRTLVSGTTARARVRWLLRAGVVGLLIATVVAVRLATLLPEVPNRNALIDDAVDRTVVDVDAADVFRGGDLFEMASSVARPDAWLTLRLLVAAPAHVLAGPNKALDAEIGVSLAFTALLFVVLGFVARCIVPSAGPATLVLVLSTLILLGNRDLFEHAVNGTLEIPSAVLTLAMAGVWVSSRASRTFQPWGVAVLGIGLYLVRPGDGLMLGAAVLLVEASEAGALRPPRSVLLALLREARSPVGLALLALALTVVAGGWRAVRTGGLNAIILGQEVSLRQLRSPLSLGMLLLLAFVELAFWRERVWLSADVPRRARFLWKWLLTPMIAWTLVPFSSRLQVLAEGTGFESTGLGPGAILDRFLGYSRSAWAGWFPPDGRWLVLALLGASLLSAWRSEPARRVLVSLGALILLPVIFLAVFRHGDFQSRLILHLAPLVALAAVVWVPAVPRAPRLLLSGAVAALLLWGVAPLWRGPNVVATLSRGFGSTADGDSCREVARALPISRGVLVNETGPERRRICGLWVKLVARERGAQVLIQEPWTRPVDHDVLVLQDGTVPAVTRIGLTLRGSEVRSGVVLGQRYRADGP